MRPKLALNEGIRDLADRIDPDALFLEVFADRRETAFAPNARTLVAAEGRKEAYRPIGVDPDRAGLEPLSHGERGPDALGPHARGKPELRVVGDLDRLVLVVESDTERTGPKTSSCAMRISGLTPVNTVGSTNHPSPHSGRALLAPPRTQEAPSLLAISM